MRKLEEDTSMAEPPTFPESNSDTGHNTSTPRWVKVFGIIAIVLVVLFGILHLVGGGFHAHTPPIEHGVQQP